MASNKTSYPQLTPSGSSHSPCFQSTSRSGVRKAKVQVEFNLDRDAQTMFQYLPQVSTIRGLPFCVWVEPGAPYSSTWASWQFYPAIHLLEWKSHELGILTRYFTCPSPHLPTSSVQGLISWDSCKQEEGKIYSPEACFSPSSPWDCQLHHLMVTDGKAAFELHITATLLASFVTRRRNL